MQPFNRGLAAVAVVLALITGGKAFGGTTTHPPHRTCPEDAVWVGTGQYAHGYWSHYTCVSWDSVPSWWKKHHS